MNNTTLATRKGSYQPCYLETIRVYVPYSYVAVVVILRHQICFQYHIPGHSSLETKQQSFYLPHEQQSDPIFCSSGRKMMATMVNKHQ